jgi:hypothetical protein
VENVGLTYFDERQGPEVLFAAQTVIAWNGAARLPALVDPSTRRKVVDGGLPRPLNDRIFGPWRQHLALPAEGRKVIGVFENLHWTRFSDSYRQNFLADLQAATEAFPELFFLMKPHPEGRWLTQRFGGKRPANDNLIVADPAAPVWNLLTAPSLMPMIDGVITTPSKVALDAAVAGVPVAVASYDGAYDLYAPLPVLRAGQDWLDFLARTANGDAASAHRAQMQDFVSRTVSSPSEPRRILDLLRARVS